MLLKDLFNECNKKELIELIKLILPIPGLNKYKKEELVSFISKIFLNEKNIGFFLEVFTPNTLKFLNDAIDKKIKINNTNICYYNTLAEKRFACAHNGMVFIPTDFAKTFKNVYNNKFKERHKIVNYIEASKLFCDRFYGIYTRKEYLNVVNLYPLAKNSPISKDVIVDLFAGEDDDFNHSDIPTDVLKKHQANKPIFVPTYDMVIEYAEKKYISTNELKIFDKYLENLGFDFVEIEEINKYLQINGTDNMGEVTKELMKGIDFHDIDEANEFLNHLMHAVNSLHVLLNRGNAPKDLSMFELPINAPIS